MAGDGYSRQFDEIAANFPNKTKCIDDTLVWTDSLSYFCQTCEWLDLCGRNGIIFNPEIFISAQDTVEFGSIVQGSDCPTTIPMT